MKNIFKNIKKSLNLNLRRGYCLHNHYDICIVGGGPVGFGLASLISSNINLQSKKLLIIEAQKNKSYVHKTDFSNRTVALSPQSRNILEKCNAWDLITKNRYHPVRKMFVWEQSSDSFITFESSETEMDLAYIVETDILQHAIIDSLENRGNVDVKYNTTVSNIDMESHQAKITLSNGSLVTSSLLIGADGHNSQIRKKFNIKSMSFGGDQKAVVAVVKFSSEIDNTAQAWQRFTKSGPVAYLPLDNQYANLIWSTSGELADSLLGLDEDTFVQALNEEMTTDEHLDLMSNRLVSCLHRFTGNYRQSPPIVAKVVTGSRAAFPLGFMHATNYVSKNIALVGDAAHRILPLAGQGINLGFGDVDCLTNALADGASIGEVINDMLRLRQYETERQRFVLPVAATVQGLQELYMSDKLPLVVARAVGLGIVNSFQPLKNFFFRGATKGNLSI